MTTIVSQLSSFRYHLTDLRVLCVSEATVLLFRKQFREGCYIIWKPSGHKDPGAASVHRCVVCLKLDTIKMKMGKKKKKKRSINTFLKQTILESLFSFLTRCQVWNFPNCGPKDKEFATWAFRKNKSSSPRHVLVANITTHSYNRKLCMVLLEECRWN